MMSLHVAEEPELALEEWSITNLLSTLEERHGDGDGTSTSKTDDRDTQKGVERSGRSKVDTGQCHLDGSVEEECVQRHFQSFGNTAPELMTGDTSITGEAARQRELSIV